MLPIKLSAPETDQSINQKRDDLIFGLIKNRYDSEWDRAGSLDTKAGNLIGFISVVVGLLLGAVTFKLAALVHSPALSIPYFLGVAILLLSIGFALGVFKIRKWTVVPNVEILVKKYANLPYEQVLQSNGSEMAKAVTKAEQLNEGKARLIEWSWYFLISGLCMVFIFAIIYAVAGANVMTGG